MPKSFIKKIVNTILNILLFFFGVVLLITIYNTIQVKVLGNDFSSFFGFSIFEVQTGSMEPEIGVGDWVIVKNESNYLLDDIITFKKGNDFITHRIIEAYKGTYVTKGDVNNAKDDAVPKELVVGRVVKVLPNFGSLKKTLFNPTVLIAIIVTLYFISILFKDRKKSEIKVRKEKRSVNGNMLNLFKKKKEAQIKEKTIEKVVKEETAPEEIIPEEDIVNEEAVSEVEEDSYSDDDLDKTIYFRMISVDEIEYNPRPSKTPSPKVKKEKAKPKAVKKNPTPKEEKKDNLTLITKKKKKFKNIYHKIMYIKETEILALINSLENNRKKEVNENSIQTTFLKKYIDGRYYNHCGDVNVEYNSKNMIIRLTKALQDSSIKISNAYHGKDKNYSKKVDYYTNLFILILNLENMFLVKEAIATKRENYINKTNKYLKKYLPSESITKSKVNELLEIQKKYLSQTKEVLDNLKTNAFALDFKEINKDVKAVNLKHNISFSKVYSDYIVDKAYSEGIIAEDKLAVLFTLLSGEIVKDMLSGQFNSYYLVYAPEELYAKSNKLSSVFAKCEDEYAKNTIIILVDYENLTKNTKAIRELIKEGFKFAVNLNDTTSIKAKDLKLIEAMEYLFIPRTRDKKEMIASLSSNTKEKIIYEDLEKKVGNYRG